MIRALCVALALLLLTTVTLATDKRTSKLAISEYMQQTGLLYIESVETLTIRCGQVSFTDSSCLSDWNTQMNAIEDRVIIRNHNTKHPAADETYFHLLQEVKYAREMYVKQTTKDAIDAWGKAYSTCAASARTVLSEGRLFNGEGGCNTAIRAAQ